MTKENVSLKDVYDAVNGLREEMTTKIEKIEKEVDKNTTWRNRMTGQITVIVIIVGIIINWLSDTIMGK